MARSGDVGGARTLLVVGLPRSGTTWIASALARTEGASLVHEPDNDRHLVAAMAAKAALGRFPVLAPGDRADPYRRLFRAAFGDGVARPGDARRREWAASLVAGGDPEDIDRVMGDRPPRRWPWRLAVARHLASSPPVTPPSPGTVIVKSVHCGLALDWLLEEVAPDQTLVVVRHPANVIGSWREMGWTLARFPWTDTSMWQGHGPPGTPVTASPPGTLIERGAWMFALLANALLHAASTHALPVLDHEQLLEDPPQRFRAVADDLGLGWTQAATDWVAASDQPGSGYELQRVASSERGRWRSRLDDAERARVAEVIGRFPLLRDRWDLGPPS